MKMAVQYWINRGERGRTRFVAFRGGYHGLPARWRYAIGRGAHAVRRTAAAASHRRSADGRRAVYALETLLACDIAGIIVAGRRRRHDVPRPAYSRGRALADKHNVLLIFDEIFTGFDTPAPCSPVSRPVSCRHHAVEGADRRHALPLAATVATQKVFETFCPTVGQGADAGRPS